MGGYYDGMLGEEVDGMTAMMDPKSSSVWN